jgi:hypothetical protein
MPVDDIELGLAGPVHFCAAVKAARNAGSVVHFAAAVYIGTLSSGKKSSDS